MQREKVRTRARCAKAPPVARRNTMNNKQRVRRVQQDACQMVSGGIETVETGSPCVGQPRQRMPVAVPVRNKSPGDGFPAQPAADMEVLCDITRVVEVDETVRRRGQEGSERSRAPARGPQWLPGFSVAPPSLEVQASCCRDPGGLLHYGKLFALKCRDFSKLISQTVSAKPVQLQRQGGFPKLVAAVSFL